MVRLEYIPADVWDTGMPVSVAAGSYTFDHKSRRILQFTSPVCHKRSKTQGASKDTTDRLDSEAIPEHLKVGNKLVAGDRVPL